MCTIFAKTGWEVNEEHKKATDGKSIYGGGKPEADWNQPPRTMWTVRAVFFFSSSSHTIPPTPYLSI